MPDKFFLSAAGADLTRGAVDARVLWSGRCAVAEYAFDEPKSLPRWTLPETSEVLVLDDRVAYRDMTSAATGGLRWAWPQHLRIQPGTDETGRSAAVTQVQVVCATDEGTFPALVFAGGDLHTVGDADRLANVLRQAIARFRVEHVAELGITEHHFRMLSRLVLGPEFDNRQGGAGQTITLPGALAVEPTTAPRHNAAYAARPEPAHAARPEPAHAARPEPAHAARPRPAHAARPRPAHGARPEPAHAARPNESRTSNLSEYLSMRRMPPSQPTGARAERVRLTAVNLARSPSARAGTSRDVQRQAPTPIPSEEQPI